MAITWQFSFNNARSEFKIYLITSALTNTAFGYKGMVPYVNYVMLQSHVTWMLVIGGYGNVCGFVMSLQNGRKQLFRQVNSIFSQLVIDVWGEYTVDNNDYLSKNHLNV